MSVAKEMQDVFEVLDLLRGRYTWFDRVLEATAVLLGKKNDEIDFLKKERDEWRRLAEWRAGTHAEGFREGRSLGDVKIAELQRDLSVRQKRYDALVKEYLALAQKHEAT